jgi:hypothetical protein
MNLYILMALGGLALVSTPVALAEKIHEEKDMRVHPLAHPDVEEKVPFEDWRKILRDKKKAEAEKLKNMLNEESSLNNADDVDEEELESLVNAIEEPLNQKSSSSSAEPNTTPNKTESQREDKVKQKAASDSLPSEGIAKVLPSQTVLEKKKQEQESKQKVLPKTAKKNDALKSKKPRNQSAKKQRDQKAGEVGQNLDNKPTLIPLEKGTPVTEAFKRIGNDSSSAFYNIGPVEEGDEGVETRVEYYYVSRGAWLISVLQPYFDRTADLVQSNPSGDTVRSIVELSRSYAFLCQLIASDDSSDRMLVAIAKAVEAHRQVVSRMKLLWPDPRPETDAFFEEYLKATFLDGVDPESVLIPAGAMQNSSYEPKKWVKDNAKEE